MAVEELKKTLVLGHRNPDTDSICSAICYAGFKHQLTGENYEPCRAGNVNPETQYVLDYFKLKAPRLVENVKTQVKDIEIRKTKGVSRGISLKNAWGLMQENNVVTLPCVTEEGLLEFFSILLYISLWISPRTSRIVPSSPLNACVSISVYSLGSLEKSKPLVSTP